MLTIERIRELIHDRKIRLVAKKAGLHYNTVRRVAADPDFVPTYETVKKLSDYFEAE